MEEFLIDVIQRIPILGPLANSNSLIWPIAEVFHFVGLALLVGAIGILDLRMLGMAKALSPASVHRLVPIGVLGFGLNLASGMVFVAANPANFIPNSIFQLKMLFIVLAGINVLYFYIWMFPKVEAVEAGGSVPAGAKVAGALSIALWMGVIITGRFMAWF